MHIRNPIEWIFAQITVPAELGSAHPTEYWSATHSATSPEVNRITLGDLREALRRGLHDFAAARTDVIFMCSSTPSSAFSLRWWMRAAACCLCFSPPPPVLPWSDPFSPPGFMR